MPKRFHPPGHGNAIVLWARERWRFEEGEAHHHHCPVCYEDKPCTMVCEFEPDLSEDSPHGAPWPCGECQKRCTCPESGDVGYPGVDPFCVVHGDE